MTEKTSGMERLSQVPGWAWFALALAVQLVIIGWIVGGQLLPSAAGGQTVYLKIEPVDPRDPLRGDYLTFTYGISGVSPWNLGGAIVKGQTVWVPLVRRNKVWVVGDSPILTSPPGKGGSPANSESGAAPGTVFIRGVLPEAAAEGQSSPVKVVYGIEEYFVPEGKGGGFPTGPGAKATARVVIGKDGKPVLQQVYVNGKPFP